MSIILKRVIPFLSFLLAAHGAGAQSISNTSSSHDSFFKQQWSLKNDGSGTIPISVDDLHTLQQRGQAGMDIGWFDARDDVARLATHPVTVAVIDSGIDTTHPELKDRIAPGAWNFLSNTATMLDDFGHGTHVSGIIAANAGNKLGIAGIAPPSVKILPLRILSLDYDHFAYKKSGILISKYAAQAINYAADHGAKVINISLGWPKIVDLEETRQAVRDAVAKGVLIVVSAGNDRKNEPTYPCDYEGVLCVGSITNNGSMALFSNSGGAVDIVAPGDAIWSLYPLNRESQGLRVQGYEVLSGTSQAAPAVAAIAATLISAYPDISLDELKARLLASAAKPPVPGASIYGIVNLKNALNAKPEPVYLPSFKGIDAATIDERTLRASGTISIKNLWQPAAGIRVEVSVNGQPSGSAATDLLKTGELLNVSWQHGFRSLDESAILQLHLKITDSTQKPREFFYELPAVRAVEDIESQKIITLPKANWIVGRKGQYFSNFRTIISYAHPTGLKQYYQQTQGSDAGSTIQIFDPASANPLATIQVPAMYLVSQIIRLDVKGTGELDWVVAGLGRDSQKKLYYQFYFMDPSFRPLLGKASAWQISLDQNPFGMSIVRNIYGAPGSWIRGVSGALLPSFIAQGVLPDPDNYSWLDPLHYRADTHLYYLAPKTQPSSADAPIQLEIRALDNADFRRKNGDITIQSMIPQTASELGQGRLKLLFQKGAKLDSQTSVLDIRSVADFSIRNVSGWDSLSSSGLPVQVYTDQLENPSAAFLSFFDQRRGSIAWSTPDGEFIERTEFAFNSLGNQVGGLLGAFDLPKQGRYWFLETSFDLAVYHNGKIQTVPLERDSSFPGEEMSEMFSPVVIGAGDSPMAGIYVDSSLVRGNQVFVVAWDASTGNLIRPLRYSLQVPGSCLQMNHVQLNSDLESFAVPFLCQSRDHAEYRIVRPISSK